LIEFRAGAISRSGGRTPGPSTTNAGAISVQRKCRKSCFAGAAPFELSGFSSGCVAGSVSLEYFVANDGTTRAVDAEGIESVYKDAYHQKPELIRKQAGFMAEEVLKIVKDDDLLKKLLSSKNSQGDEIKP
jgi:hypothetical protein